MIDLGLSKMALIGAVALIVIGPEKLPRVARTVGTLLGRAQRYINEVKAEVNQAMDIDEIKRMKDTVEQTGREVERNLRQASANFEQEVRNVGATLSNAGGSAGSSSDDGVVAFGTHKPAPPPYRWPRKNWRVKRGATPQWYKARVSVRRHLLSASARVARYRPKQTPGRT
jgi:sec-independent protein translocase protein TatB